MYRIITCLLVVIALTTVGCAKKDNSKNSNQDSSGSKTSTDNKNSSADQNTGKQNKSGDGTSNSGKQSKTASQPLYDGPFHDDVASNNKPPKSVSDLKFKDKNGKTISIADYMDKKNLVLVFTKGFSGMICPYCKTQTSRLIANYKKFAAADAEVIVVFPGDRGKLDDFMKAALETEKEEIDTVPFPIVLDEDFVATDFFDIRGSLVEPSTFILDKKGKVQLAYVAQENNTTDRPSVTAMLKKLKQVNQ